MADDEKLSATNKSMNMDIPRGNKPGAGQWPPLGRFSVDRTTERSSFFQFPRSLSITSDNMAAVSPIKKFSDRGGREDEFNGYPARKRTTTFSAYGSNDSGVSSPSPDPSPVQPTGPTPYSSRLFRRSNSISVANPSANLASGRYRNDSGHGEFFKISIGQLFGEKQTRTPSPKPFPQLKPKSPSSQVIKDDLVSMLCETSIR